MSTYLYLVCENHDPPLVSEDEVGQHLYDLPSIRDWIAADRDNLPDWWDLWNPANGGDDYFGARACKFLDQHRTCNIGIVDEYGVSHENA